MRPEADPATANDIALRPRRTCHARRPSGGSGNGIEHAEPTLIADVFAPELERIELGGEGKLVDRLLGGECKRQIEG